MATKLRVVEKNIRVPVDFLKISFSPMKSPLSYTHNIFAPITNHVRDALFATNALDSMGSTVHVIKVSF